MSWSVGWTARSSTPCPSTTLFRSRGQNALRHRFMQVRGWLSEGPLTLLDVGCGEGHSLKYFSEWPTPQPTSSSVNGRSEEHTSAPQSLTNLACRLPLEKNKWPQPT